MSSILVTGANGFVGRVLCEELARRGYSVRAVIRTSAKLEIAGCDTVKISSIDADTDWTDALSGVDTVIHLAARVHVMHDNASNPLEEFRKTNVVGTVQLAQCAAAAGVKRFIYMSSIKVNGEETRDDEKFTECDRPSPQDPYGVSKWEAEQALHRVAQETRLEVVIIRPPLVYGTGVKGNFAQMLKVLASGIPLPLASLENQRSLVYVGNLVDAVILCAGHPAAAGKTYLVSDGEDISTPDLLRKLGATMGHRARLFLCPPALLRLAGRVTGRADQIERLTGSLRVDSSKIRCELGWVPPYALQQGLQMTAMGR